MPRRPAAQKVAPVQHAPTTPQPVGATLAPELYSLRTNWKWAAFSQFFYTFAPLVAADDLSLADIENDLAFGTSVYLPRIMQRLLYTLTQDRKLNGTNANWQTVLRRQYLRRDPDACPIGYEPPRNGPSAIMSVNASRYNSVSSPAPLPSTSETPAPDSNTPAGSPPAEDEVHEDSTPNAPLPDWLELPTLAKLDSLHALMEWQFQNPTRLRAVMRNEDEEALWRIEPIGYDSKANAYWYIEDRLWIQRVPPKPPRNLKRSRTKSQPKPAKKPRLQATSSSRTTAATVKSAKPTTSRNGRAAKQSAKQKLDAQARELDRLNKQAALEAKSNKKAKNPYPKPAGTRVSSRLRGAANNDDDGWQEIPSEWLNKDAAAADKKRKTGLESDEETISDLTELSGDEEEQAAESAMDVDPPVEEEVEEEDAEEEVKSEPEPEPLPADFIEWETICVTLWEWEHVAEQFAKATHYTEKALHKVLVNDVVPYVTGKLKEIQRKQRLEAAVVQRKRSSRIAMKESEKEEARAVAQKKAEEEERQSRARRFEARQRKEELQRQKREEAREQRRREREDQEAKESGRSTPTIDVVGDAPPTNGQQTPSTENQASNGTHTPEEWILNCEICRRRGKNLDDGAPLICCGRCQQWQHIECHNAAARSMGYHPPNWKMVDFTCSQCRGMPPPQFIPVPPPFALNGGHHLPPNGHIYPLPQPNGYSLHPNMYPNNPPWPHAMVNPLGHLPLHSARP